MHSTEMLVEHAMVGGVVSRTVTVKEQLLLLPAASLATQETVVMPGGNRLLEAGEQARAGAGSQASEAVVT